MTVVKEHFNFDIEVKVCILLLHHIAIWSFLVKRDVLQGVNVNWFSLISSKKRKVSITKLCSAFDLLNGSQPQSLELSV